MKAMKRRIRPAWIVGLPLLLVFAGGVSAGAEENRVSKAISFDRTWAESVGLVREGRYEEAAKRLDSIVGAGPASEEASAWMKEWMEAEKARWQLTQQDHEKYVERAKQQIEAGEWLKALDWAYRAKLNANDADGFLAVDWMADLKRESIAEGERLRDDHSWLDAHHIFYWLSLIFDRDKAIEQQRSDCFEHARLESIYAEDNKDWAEPLEGIDASMVEEALYRIDQKYVKEPDFKELTLAGYNELMLLAESPTLQTRFEKLAGERGEDFRSRIQRKIQQIKNEPGVTYRNAEEYFRRALMINQQTAQLPERLVVKEYMNAALNKLDEFSSMIWPIDFREFEKHTRGDFIGVGIQIRNKYNPDLQENEIVVVSPLEDTPAYRAGVQANDIITAVNGQSLLGVAVTKAVTMITGPKGTTVTLTIRRDQDDGEAVHTDFRLRREEIKIYSVKGLKRSDQDEQRWDFIIDKERGIAYLRLTSFQDNTIAHLQAALSEASVQGMKGLILDLRGNPGGLLKTAIEVSELFLAKEDRIVSTGGRRSAEYFVNAEKDGRYKDVPLIVMINEGSASASEIVSGAIKDHKRGIVIGERSFGKFSVQNLIQLVNSEAHLKLTTAKYYLPSGRSLHRDPDATDWGVEPDISVALVPKEQRKIIFMQRDADVIGAVKTSSEAELKEAIKPVEDDDAKDKAADGAADPADDDPADDELAESELDENDRPNRDPQLETALLAMRMHLLHEQYSQMARMRTVEPSKITNE